MKAEKVYSNVDVSITMSLKEARWLKFLAGFDETIPNAVCILTSTMSPTEVNKLLRDIRKQLCKLELEKE